MLFRSMRQALEEVVRDPLMRQQIGQAFAQLADFMRNKDLEG